MRPSAALSSSFGTSFASQTHHFKAQYIGCQTTGKSSMAIGTKKVCIWLELGECSAASACALSSPRLVNYLHLHSISDLNLLQITGNTAPLRAWCQPTLCNLAPCQKVCTHTLLSRPAFVKHVTCTAPSWYKIYRCCVLHWTSFEEWASYGQGHMYPTLGEDTRFTNKTLL